MSTRRLRILLALALLATIAAALFPTTNQPNVVVPATRNAVGGGAIGEATAAAAVSVTPGLPQSQSLADAPAPVSGKVPEIAPASAARVAGIAILDLARLRRSASVIEGGDPFVLPPPPAPPPPKARKAAAPPPPPPPRAPPLPFRMIGSLDEEGKVTVFAERANGDVVALRVADIVDNTYRIDAINARTMILTYLPLGQQQTLPLGEAIR
jgi:hypothetical protein